MKIQNLIMLLLGISFLSGCSGSDDDSAGGDGNPQNKKNHESISITF